MKNSILLFILFFVSIQTATSAELPLYSTKYDPSRDAFQDGRDAIKLAGETNRRILIELGGDWCKWCHFMDRFLNTHPAVKKQLHETFVVLKVNVSEENNNHNFLKAFPRPLGYPHMFITESNGKLIYSKDTAEFVINRKYSVERFEAFFKRWAIQKKLVHG